MSPKFVENSLNRLLILFNSKSKSVMSTASAALNQLFSHVVNKLIQSTIQNDETTAEPDEANFDPDEEVKGSMTMKMSVGKTQSPDLALTIASQLLKGLVSHLSPNKETEWPIPVNNLSIGLSLDLLSLIILEGKQELTKYSELMIILDEVFDPLLLRMKSAKSEYSTSIRLIN
jgi:hypothetical protein